MIIYKQAPRPETPPPLVIRERPPSPLNQPTEPFIIEKRVAAPRCEQRKVIIEHLPAPPAKPRDIILEKWLPRAPPTERTIYYQKLNQKRPTFYEILDKRDHYDVMDALSLPPAICASSSKHQQHKKAAAVANAGAAAAPAGTYYSTKKFCNSGDQFIYESSLLNNNSVTNLSSHQQPTTESIYYSGKKSNPKIAGYRIIRQIIPGPNSTPAEIEKALARLLLI